MKPTESAPAVPQVPIVVQQHAEESALLHNSRSHLLRAADIRLRDLSRHDERLAAHLDGLSTAGALGRQLAQAALAQPDSSAVFTATVLALEDHQLDALSKLLSLVQALPDALPGLVGAFGWVSATHLRGITKPLLDSTNPHHKAIGLLACAMHQVNPGAALATALTDSSAPLRACAIQVAGELGRVELLAPCVSSLRDPDPACSHHAARSAALLGNRHEALEALHQQARVPGPHRMAAMACWLMLADAADARALLKSLSADPTLARTLIRGVGLSGDVHYVPWLLKQMASPVIARLAGESFSLITGLDVAALRMQQAAPEGAGTGPTDAPTDDPADDNVALDEDDSLPWTDPAKLSAWWQANSQRFTPGTRYFLGAPPTTAHCLTVLKTGFQRQRIAAAQYLSLLQPGTSLFNTAAPAWRQQRLLAPMGA